MRLKIVEIKKLSINQRNKYSTSILYLYFNYFGVILNLKTIYATHGYMQSGALTITVGSQREQLEPNAEFSCSFHIAYGRRFLSSWYPENTANSFVGILIIT